jgi:hypothetical protein
VADAAPVGLSKRSFARVATSSALALVEVDGRAAATSSTPGDGYGVLGRSSSAGHLADRLLDAGLEFTTTHDSWPTVVDSP